MELAGGAREDTGSILRLQGGVCRENVTERRVLAIRRCPHLPFRGQCSALAVALTILGINILSSNTPSVPQEEILHLSHVHISAFTAQFGPTMGQNSSSAVEMTLRNNQRFRCDSGNITSHPTIYVHILAITLVAKSIMIMGLVLVS